MASRKPSSLAQKPAPSVVLEEPRPEAAAWAEDDIGGFQGPKIKKM